MSDAQNLPSFEMPGHLGEDGSLPCFACFLEQLVAAVNRQYEDEPDDDYDIALTTAIHAIATNVGALIAAVDPQPAGMRGGFVACLDASIALHTMIDGARH